MPQPQTCVAFHESILMRLPLPPAVLILLAGCSSAIAGADRSVLLSDKPPARPTCHILWQPAPLPSLSQLADSAALTAALSHFAERNPLREGSSRALYSLAFDASGRVERLKAIDYWLPQGQEEAFTALVRQHLRPEIDLPASMRLLVQPDSEPMVKIGRSERCPPQSGTSFRLFAPALSQLQRPQPLRVRIHVDEKGRVRGIQLLSSSGDAELDRWVTDTLQRYEFSPGLIDGVPTAMDHEQNIQIQARP